MTKSEISKAALGRIPQYIRCIVNLPEDVVYVSATLIAKELGLGEVQVRKDLALLCKKGRPKVGYVRQELLESLQEFLECGDGNAVIVGIGKLGRALIDYPEFENYGTKILAGFDKEINEEIELPSGKKLYPQECLEEFCEENKVNLGIIAVPPDSAQTVLNRLYSCGIKQIWCLAPCRLYTPADVIIQYENMALSLAHLKLQSNQNKTTEVKT